MRGLLTWPRRTDDPVPADSPEPTAESPKGFIGIIRSGGSVYPDAGDSGSKSFAPSPRKMSFRNPTTLAPYAGSDVYLFGYRPLILTLATEAAMPDGDFIIVEQALDGPAFLFRTTKITSIKPSTTGTTRTRHNESGHNCRWAGSSRKQAGDMRARCFT